MTSTTSPVSAGPVSADPISADPVSAVRHSAQDIAELLIAEIRNGELASGEPLPTERALAERFGTSRPTVREALTDMQHRGFVESGGGKRPRAIRPSLQSILALAAGHVRSALGNAEIGANVEQLRLFIETGAAREAALKASHLHLVQIKSALDQNFADIGTAHFAKSDIAFHRAIVAVVSNPILLQLHDMFVTSMLESRAPTDDPVKYDRLAHAEHQAIYQAILDRDLVTATNVMEGHLARSFRARLQATAAVQPNRAPDP